MDTAPARRGDSTSTPPATTAAPAPPAAAAPAPIDRFRWGIEQWAASTIVKHAAGRANASQAKTVDWIERELRQYAAELAGPNPTPVERTLCETAALTWFVARYIETNVFAIGDRTLKQADYDTRRLDAAHRRHLAVIRTLAQVRKLAVPALQINIGRNQVNTATAGG